MKTYAVKLTTGENLAYSSLAEIHEIMDKVKDARLQLSKYDNPNILIELKHMEGNTTCQVFPEFIMGFVEIGGDGLESIVNSSRKSLHEEMAEVSEFNLYSEKLIL